MLKRILRSLITHPLAQDVDLDSAESTLRRCRIIQKKSFLKKFYCECYRSIASSLPQDVNGSVLELGTGSGFLREYMDDLVTSDILYLPHIDMVLEGQNLPFRRESLRAIVMLDVFHHLPSVERFLCGAADCLKPGGVVTMIEPWTTMWSHWVYRNLHHEPFDPDAKQWNFPKGGPLSQANSALPWIVFERDRQKFERNFPEWRINEIHLHTPFCYLLSGGVSFRSFLPGILYPVCRRIENLFQPWMHSWAMFAKIVLRKK